MLPRHSLEHVALLALVKRPAAEKAGTLGCEHASHMHEAAPSHRLFARLTPVTYTTHRPARVLLGVGRPAAADDAWAVGAHELIAAIRSSWSAPIVAAALLLCGCWRQSAAIAAPVAPAVVAGAMQLLRGRCRLPIARAPVVVCRMRRICNAWAGGDKVSWH